MRFTQLLLPITFLFSHFSHTLADGASISAAIAKISDATIALNKTVVSFPANPIYGLTDIGELLVNSNTLLQSIKSGTKVAEASANLTNGEAISIAGKTQALTSVVQSTLDTVISAKHKFDKLLIVSPVVLLNLKQEKSATEDFGAAVVEKVPVPLQGIAKNLLVPIGTAFDKAIAAYKLF